MIKDKNIAEDAAIDIGKLAFQSFGKEYYAAKSTGALYALLKEKNVPISTKLFTTLLAAYNKTVTGRNDRIWLSPDSNSLGASLTWSKNLVHLFGAGPVGFMNQRTRIGMSTTFTPMITVSGYGNWFHNIYSMHGTAAGDYVGWAISGARNVFTNVHFGGPMIAAQGGHASYVGVDITGSENSFRNCVFGTDTIGRDEVTPNVQLGAGTLTYFENCTFLCNLTDGDPVFVKADNTSGYTWAIFKDCTFHAFNANYATGMTAAFTFSGGSSCAMMFKGNNDFINVSAISDTAYDQYIWLSRRFVTTTDTEAMRNVQLTI